MITIDDVRAAAEQLDGVAHRTPVLTSRTLDETTGAIVFLKAENFQRTGSFKFRGAYNLISRLSDEELARGLVTVSSGNHAQAVALAAKLCGTSALIYLPQDAPEAKRLAVESYGAEIVEFDRYAVDRDALVGEDKEHVFVPPYNHPLIMAGQGTAALELFADVRNLEALIVPMSGGGLMAGCSTVAKAQRSGIHVVGVEPEAGDDTRRSLQSGQRIAIPTPRTIADGLQVNVPGELTFEVNKRNVDDVVLVSDTEIVNAMRFVFARLKVVIEPSGAVGIAALLEGKIDVPSKRVGVIVSGGNVGVERFAELTNQRAD